MERQTIKQERWGPFAAYVFDEKTGERIPIRSQQIGFWGFMLLAFAGAIQVTALVLSIFF